MTNKALVNVKDSLKHNAKQTIDYISEINKGVQEEQDIETIKAPQLKNLQHCLNELTQTMQTFHRI